MAKKKKRSPKLPRQDGTNQILRVMKNRGCLKLQLGAMSLQQRLAKYLMARPRVKIAEERYTGENTGRRLRYLETCYHVIAQEEPEPQTATRSKK